jgi:predicted ArsR family transcriptional regulator
MKDLGSATRRRIISLLRSNDRTVAELAGELGLTDNAVRSHLQTLQRQKLVVSSGTRPGTRKPHAAFSLTVEARRAFFEGCEPLLSHLISALAGQLSPEQFEKALRESGRRIARAASSGRKAGSVGQRVGCALKALQSLGGQAVLEHQDGKMVIRGAACPWAVLVNEHPEVCLAAESLLAEMIQVPVRQHCERGRSPHCAFEIG